MTMIDVLPKGIVSDKRPDPKEKKNTKLWQTYLWWFELVELRKRHLLRISSAERGKSNFDAEYENMLLDSIQVDRQIDDTKAMMIALGEQIGPIWQWVTSIKGLRSGSLAAQLLAQIDDIEKFDTVAKLWRFCGYGIYEYWIDEGGKVQAPKDGWQWVNKELAFRMAEPKPNWKLKKMADRNVSGWLSPFNRKLKGICWNVADQFIRQQTPIYVDTYYSEKIRLRELYPEIVKNGNGKKDFTDGHIHNRALRKMIKAFLKDLWIEWKGIG